MRAAQTCSAARPLGRGQRLRRSQAQVGREQLSGLLLEARATRSVKKPTEVNAGTATTSAATKHPTSPERQSRDMRRDIG